MSTLESGRFGALRDALFAGAFAPDASDSRKIGAEVELLVLDGETRRPLPLLDGPRGLVPRLRRLAARWGWSECSGYGVVPRFDVPGLASISFEPGGQIEISSVPCTSASALLVALRDVVTPLCRALADEGVLVESSGIDSYNDARDIPLQLAVPRYERMTRYFDSIGPYGIRMMRQTAAIQVSLDRGADPASRWRLLNDLAPYLIAIFANSPHYRCTDTGHRSYRAHCWRMLDSTRTGISAPDDDPAVAYVRFALAAHDILQPDSDRQHQPFSAQIAAGATIDAWQTHLTTLFPEVRPRGHFEVRSCDAVDPAWYAAPIVLLAGLVYDPHSAREAALLAAESRVLLRAAGMLGLRDASIARTCRDLFQLALDGAERIGPAYVGGGDVEIARQFFQEYTARERSPADDRTLPSVSSDALTVARSR